MNDSQRRAVRNHRRRQKAKAMVRVEVQASATDAPLLKTVAAALRGELRRARDVRARLRAALQSGEGGLLERLACDLPDSVVERALRRPVDRGRPVRL